MATLMSNKKQCSAFLKTIPPGCKKASQSSLRVLLRVTDQGFPSWLVMPFLIFPCVLRLRSMAHMLPNAPLPTQALPGDKVLPTPEDLGSLPTQLLGSASLKTGKWWECWKCSIMMRSYSRPCPERRGIRLCHSARPRVPQGWSKQPQPILLPLSAKLQIPFFGSSEKTRT